MTEYVLHERRNACENSRYHVYLDEVQGGPGEKVEDYLVVSPKNTNESLLTGVAVLPLIEGKVGLVKMYRHAIQETCWEIPRGFVDAEETPAQAAIRELEEETGYTCRPEDLISIGLITPDAGTLAARLHLFVAIHCSEKLAARKEEFGLCGFQLFGLETLRAMEDHLQIQDPCTLLALYKHCYRQM